MPGARVTSGWKYTGKKLLSSGLYFIAVVSLLTFVRYSQKPYKKYGRETRETT